MPAAMASSSQRGAAKERNAPPVGDVNAPRAPPAPDQLDSFNELLQKVVTAGMLSRYDRHQELAGRAAAQAEVLFKAKDSLIVASLNRTAANALWKLSCVAEGEGGSDTEVASLRRRAWALLLPLHALLLRRVAANTLLLGTLREEESEFGANVESFAYRAVNKPAPTNAHLQAVGRLVGYKVLLEVVASTVKLLE